MKRKILIMRREFYFYIEFVFWSFLFSKSRLIMVNGKLLIIICFSSQFILKFPSDDPNLDLKKERTSIVRWKYGVRNHFEMTRILAGGEDDRRRSVDATISIRIDQRE